MVYANKQAPEKMARPVTQGIPQNWIIYSMPISSLVELYKVAKARLLLTLGHSADEKTGGAGTHVRTGTVCEASRGTSRK